MDAAVHLSTPVIASGAIAGDVPLHQQTDNGFSCLNMGAVIGLVCFILCLSRRWVNCMLQKHGNCWAMKTTSQFLLLCALLVQSSVATRYREVASGVFKSVSRVLCLLMRACVNRDLCFTWVCAHRKYQRLRGCPTCVVCHGGVPRRE